VATSGIWKKKDKSKIKDYKEYEPTCDWTYSSAYKGTFKYLSDSAKKIMDETNLDIDFNKDGKKDTMTLTATPEAAIPFDMLSPQNPIKHFAEIYLFESDLEDCGYAMSNVRYRVMGDCFYILLRYYLKVDDICVRIFDTRIFHAYGEDYIHREFQYRESSYEKLKA